MARDRYDDEEYDDRDEPGPPPAGYGDPAAALARLTGPGVGLVLVGLIGMALFAYGLLAAPAGGQAAQLKEKREEQLKQIDDGPGQPAQKQQQKDMVNGIYDAVDKVAPLFPVLTGLLVVGTLVVLAGGVQLLRGRSRGLGMTAAVLAMIPCFSSCGCVLGIPIGIWALVVLGSPDVKAAFAAASGPRDTLADDLDDRG